MGPFSLTTEGGADRAYDSYGTEVRRHHGLSGVVSIGQASDGIVGQTGVCSREHMRRCNVIAHPRDSFQTVCPEHGAAVRPQPRRS